MKFSEFLLEAANGTGTYTYITLSYSENSSVGAAAVKALVAKSFPTVKMEVLDFDNTLTDLWSIFQCTSNKLDTLVNLADELGDYASDLIKRGEHLSRMYYDASELNLKNLTSIPASLDCPLNLYVNDLTSLENIAKHFKRINGEINFEMNPITSHVLGLLKIPGIREVYLHHPAVSDLSKVNDIINKYLPNDRGNDSVLECQNELIDAGLDDFAQL